jgi:hypothetical protein
MMSLRVAAVAAALTPLISLIAAPEATATGPVVDYSPCPIHLKANVVRAVQAVVNEKVNLVEFCE